MRLSDVLSRPLDNKYTKVEGFLNGKKLARGKQKKITVGTVVLPYWCKTCEDAYSFYSDDALFCIGVNDNLISIDCVLKCPRCTSLVQVWFLVTCYNGASALEPEVRVSKRSEQLSDTVSFSLTHLGDFTYFLEKAHRAYNEGLGAGSVVYLRKIFEQITLDTARVAGIAIKRKNNNRKCFKEILQEVDELCTIIPREFSDNGYKLFGDLSNVLHGSFDEDEALKKYNAFRRLVVGIIENIKNNQEITKASQDLWHNNGGASHV